VPATDGGMMAANLYRQLALTHLAGEELRVWPRKRLPVEEFAHAPSITPPPLVKGYLRAGAVLLGEPHVDADFGSIDFPMLLSLDSTERRYLRRFVPALAPQIVA
jgi:putative hemolysin